MIATALCAPAVSNELQTPVVAREYGPLVWRHCCRITTASKPCTHMPIISSGNASFLSPLYPPSQLHFFNYDSCAASHGPASKSPTIDRLAFLSLALSPALPLTSSFSPSHLHVLNHNPVVAMVQGAQVSLQAEPLLLKVRAPGLPPARGTPPYSHT